MCWITFETVGAGSVSAIRDAVTKTMSEDVIWHVPITAQNGGTTVGRDSVLELLTGNMGVSIYWDGSMEVTLEAMIAEGDFVATEDR